MIIRNRTRFFSLTIFLLNYHLIFTQLPHSEYRLEIFKPGFSQPLGFENADDGTGRIFVVEKGGRIKIIENGSILPTPFLDISTKVSTGGEQGLLGLAFHPNYSNNGYFYVNYTNTSGDSQISRYSVSSNTNVANAASELAILFVDQPDVNHNGGDLNFGPDGYLYIAFGDGGGGGDPSNYAQNRLSLLGKMLRIDIDNGSPYSIPSTNPFISDINTRDEIWALGLRNPWRFSFDRVTGDMWIGDVGQNAREEVNFQPANSTGGENYGWRCYEGDIAYNTNNCASIGNYVFPVFAEKHSNSNANSLAGGMVYRGSNECLQGIYFCAETRADTFFTMVPNGNGWSVGRKLFPGVANIAAFGEDESGELYAVSLSGTIYQIRGPEELINADPIAPGTYTSNGSIQVEGSVQTGLVELIAPEFVQVNQPFEVQSGASFFVTLGCDL